MKKYIKKLIMLAPLISVFPALSAASVNNVSATHSSFDKKSNLNNNDPQYKYKKYTKKDGITSDEIDCVTATPDNKYVYFGTWNKGVYQGINKNGKWTFKNLIKTDYVNKVYVSSDNSHLYISTDWEFIVGISKNNQWKWQWYRTPKFPGNGSFDVRASSDNKTIYVNSDKGWTIGKLQKNGKYKFNIVKGAPKKMTSFYSINDFKTVFFGTSKNLWIGKLQSDGTYNYKRYSNEALNSGTIWSIYSTPDAKTILVGGAPNSSGSKKGGLNVGKLQSDGTYKFTRYSATQGMGSNHVMSVDGTNDGKNIFITSTAFNHPGGFFIGTLQSDGTYKFKRQLDYPFMNSAYTPNNGKNIFVTGIQLSSGVVFQIGTRL